MSGMIEKSISGLFSALGGGSPSGSLSSSNYSSGLKFVSLGLVAYVERLEAARKISKQEEEDLFKNECQEWLKQISHHGVTSGVVADILCRALIANSRGLHLSDLEIHAIKLTHCTNIVHKKIGLLYISTTMAPGSDLAVLMVNTVQRSLTCPNVVEISFGLNLIPNMMNQDTLPTIANSLALCLVHQEPCIRRKSTAIITSISLSMEERLNFYSCIVTDLIQLLTDVDPSVAIAATVSLSKIYHKLLDDVPNKLSLLENVSKSCAHLLIQAIEGSLPNHFDIGFCKAPFVQIQLLRAVQRIGSHNWIAPEVLISSLELVLSQQLTGKELTLYAVLFEAVVTLRFLPRRETLISGALKVINGFLRSSLVDFKYLGIKALTVIFPMIKENLTKTQLEAVLDCLYHPNILLQSRTIKVLCLMSNKHNYQTICATLLEFFHKSQTPHLKEHVKVCMSDIIKTSCYDVKWCLSFLSHLLNSQNCDKNFLEALSFVTIRVLSDEQKIDAELIQECDDILQLLLNIDNPSGHHLKTCISIINKLVSFQPKYVKCKTINDLLLKLSFVNLEEYDSSFFECLTKCGLYFSLDICDKIKYLLTNVSQGYNFSTKLRANETLNFLNNPQVCKRVMQKQAQILNGNLVPDLTLSFCDGYVLESLKGGHIPFLPVPIHSKSIIDDKWSHTRGSSPTFLSLEAASIQDSFRSNNSLSGIEDSFFRREDDTLPKWTTKGRQKAANDKTPELERSSASEATAIVEIAAEADEVSLKSLELDASPRSTSFLESRRDLTQAIFRSLWSSKET